MGLLPLEFSDCLLDSPYFRENLKSHEKQLEDTSTGIKELITGIQGVLDAAKTLSQAQSHLAEILTNFQFDCLGTTLTDDEIIISSSLKQFGKFLTAIEQELSRVVDHAAERFIQPLLNFRKEQIGSVKQSKKCFEKATQKLCTAQDRYISTSGKKEESLIELSDTLRLEQRALHSSSLEYVYNIQIVQERKKFLFVSAILNFTESWAEHYSKGNTLAVEHGTYLADLAARVEKTRHNFSSTVDQYEALKNKMKSNYQDPGAFNKMYTRQGYLYLQEKKNLKLGSGWSKYYCQYQAKSKILTLIPYSQIVGRIGTGESVRVLSCLCREDTAEKFRFSVTGQETREQAVTTYTMQALSDQDRRHWVEALGGTWPAVNTLQRIKADSVEENLHSSAFTFLKDCLQELENRGLADHGLYRVGGVVSKVKKLLNQAIDPQPGDSVIDLTDPKQWESKTLASAVKQYLRELSKPLMTYSLYNSFIAAVKLEKDGERVGEVARVVHQLPQANKEILKVLIHHLSKVAAKSDKNLMTASNLGVCFGPTLLRSREETVASILDIKFSNEVIEILIENADTIFPSADSSPEISSSRRQGSLNTSSLPDITEDSSDTAAGFGTPSSTANGVGSPAETPVADAMSEDVIDGLVKSTPPILNSSSCSSTINNVNSSNNKNNNSSSNSSNSSSSSNSCPVSQTPSSEGQLSQSTHSVYKGKRTQSFSSFSELSINSLPDMTSLASSSDRPRSKSHQHDSPPQLITAAATNNNNNSSSSRAERKPTPALTQAAIQANFLSSLEMMNSLAADLPLPASPLRRSSTLLPSRMRKTPSREVTRKPPLPKLLTVSGSSPTTTTPSSSSSNSPPLATVNSQTRPTNLPVKLALDGLCLSPATTRKSSHNTLMIQEQRALDSPDTSVYNEYRERDRDRRQDNIRDMDLDAKSFGDSRRRSESVEKRSDSKDERPDYRETRTLGGWYDVGGYRSADHPPPLRARTLSPDTERATAAFPPSSSSSNHLGGAAFPASPSLTSPLRLCTASPYNSSLYIQHHHDNSPSSTSSPLNTRRSTLSPSPSSSRRSPVSTSSPGSLRRSPPLSPSISSSLGDNNSVLSLIYSEKSDESVSRYDNLYENPPSTANERRGSHQEHRNHQHQQEEHHQVQHHQQEEQQQRSEAAGDLTTSWTSRGRNSFSSNNNNNNNREDPADWPAAAARGGQVGGRGEDFGNLCSPPPAEKEARGQVVQLRQHVANHNIWRTNNAEEDNNSIARIQDGGDDRLTTRHRDSGPYENVREREGEEGGKEGSEEETSTVTKGRDSLGWSPTTPDILSSTTGLHSLRNILTTGQTSNV